MGRFRWRSGSRVEGLARAARPVPPPALEGELVRMEQRLPARRGGLRGLLVAVAFSVLVLTGLAAGGGIGTAAALAGHSAMSVPPCRQCTLATKAVSRSLYDSQRLVDNTRTLAKRIRKHPTAKNGINSALRQATQVGVQARKLLKQAALIKNPVDRLRLINAARVEAVGVKNLATLAHVYALATLKAEGRP